MSKKLTGLLILSAVLTLPAMAAYNGPGPASHVKTAAEAAKAQDDTPVELTGYLVQSLGDEKYLFRDESGDVEVEIDNALWRDIEVSPDSKVKLVGEVDDEWQGIEIEIDSMRLISE
ncbi:MULTISPECIES: NirD/YgiW/YdeI family stress tolerance protein [Shewanella]|uniref:NirD/YgiW/YdeI family stress tolerance protein n=1 Tax=Shewanella fidelis TaxID=173509 RepID=A0AAW8NW76_9GAMM|nr:MULTISPECIES: NirD/YgiW/YdeI family stress tolerance protein [Shewanella]MDR8525723.1 NirD/YgiW/YdeI family stress tolerance protein [Shewanella fidelis]MDW4812768.1 NirD/YgiW/YdeI family stress tolerance protein [Shewanella fidelis]MDW4816516.1 NirD/YgiW/YdeI family stress tolerance protein [Shewanella fidelis]MDW4820320.1 NirD/YgiW/YdeI family stress tolerance protein [Shewanella fidelis]MDW4825232.1 NirD/YgiW/YdeI family stress tolerance protein [Shewanella fidelis]